MSESSAKSQPGPQVTGEDEVRRLFSEVPPAPKHNPVAQSIARANELGEKAIATTLGYFLTMPASTSIIANPPLHQVDVDCDGTPITLQIRSFTIRGIIPEPDIVKGQAGPYAVIFAGLFGRAPEASEETLLARIIDQKFFSSLGFDGGTGSFDASLINEVAEFVKEFPDLGPELAMQHFSILRKARKARSGQVLGVNEERESGELLMELVTTHMENVAIGATSAYLNHVHAENRQLGAQELADAAQSFIEEERGRGKSAFSVCYSLMLGHHTNDDECLILERMGTIQIHHGSAGSNMVARYMTTLHTLSVDDFFVASQMAMDSARHFGAIHDMTTFIQQLEPLDEEARAALIRDKVLGGGLPTFGHPEIAAAGRGNSVQQDPRPAIYIAPLFDAIDSGQITLTPRRHDRLNIARQLYRAAFVRGVFKPNRENEPPLRLTTNTDFGAWCVQEGLGVEEENRTLLTYIFRGFGWMMDAREQLQQKMIRPVIAPDPQIIPKSSSDHTIPELVARVHQRLASDEPFSPHAQ